MEDLLFLPDCRKTGTFLDEEALNFVKVVFKDKAFDGLISIATRNSSGGFKTIGPVPCSQIEQFAERMTILPDHDYYLTPNIFSNEKRLSDTLLAINALVIDVDCHGKQYSPDELDQRIEALVWRLRNDCFDCGDLPHPNYIVLTGRGVQLWWCVVPAHAKSFSGNFVDVERHFSSKLADLISQFPSELSYFSVDQAASSKVNGFFRFPGTVNTKCGKQVEVISFHEQRLNLRIFRDEHLPISAKANRIKTNSALFRAYTPNTLKDVLSRRLDALEKLRDMRDAPVGNEIRNNLCFLYYVMAKPIYGDADACQRTRDFNSEFKVPLTEKELKGCICSARRKNYKYRTKAIVELLDISDDEAAEIGLQVSKAKPSATKETNKRSNQKKEDRNHKIITMFNQGLRQKEIAEQLGISCSTVCKIIKDNACAIVTLSDRIWMLLENGKTPVEIGRTLNCSVRTVERYKVNPTKNRTSIGERCDKNSKKEPPIYGLGFGGKGEGQNLNQKPVLTVSAEGYQQLKQAPIKESNCPNNPGEADPYGPFFRGDMPFIENDSLVADVEDTAPARLEAAALGTLMFALERDGNLYINQSAMKWQMNYFLWHFSSPGRSQPALTDQQVFDACSSLCRKGLVVADHSTTEGICYFLMTNYTNEMGAARLLSAMIASQPKCTLDVAAIPLAIQQYEVETGLALSAGQKDAIHLALTNPVAVITGGPGTGKTATMAALCHVVRNLAPKARVELCATTGKAAVHLSAVTGMPAKTIHSRKSRKIACDFLIVDEASMVDVELLYDMLKMINNGTHLVFIGDPDQLPCIGAGNVLRDVIACQQIPTVNLSQVYRQAEQNDIITYANTIKAAPENILLPRSSSVDDDICFIRLQEVADIEQKIVEITESLKNTGHMATDIQILTPTREWSSNLNLRLKSVFNQASNGKNTEPYSIGDCIIYNQNDYVRKLHNGQAGMVSSVTTKTVTVNYDGRTIHHKKADFEHLELAYALTIHKAQGSEYPIVIIPIHESMGRALTRNLTYTAITRAKEKCILVGSEQALRMALGRTLSGTHRSLLAERLANA